MCTVPPACCLSLISPASTSPVISVVGPQPGSASVLDTTTFGVLVIISACGGAPGPVNTARNSS